MMRKLAVALGGAALLFGALGFGTGAQAQGGVKVGVLTCGVSSGWGFVFGSSRHLRCLFSPSGGHPEHYVGTVSKFGVDIGYTAAATIMWAVVAPTASLRPGALAGTYIGATGSAAVGVGAGANVLVGGSQHTITLQPVSIEGQTGLNVAAGIASFTLRHVR